MYKIRKSTQLVLILKNLNNPDGDRLSKCTLELDGLIESEVKRIKVNDIIFNRAHNDDDVIDYEFNDNGITNYVTFITYIAEDALQDVKNNISNIVKNWDFKSKIK